MDKQHATQLLESVTIDKGIQLVAHLCHCLTIVSRDTYASSDGGVINPERLRRLNEIQHSVTGVLLDLIKNQQLERLSVLPDIFFAQRDDLRLNQLLEFCLQQSLSALGEGEALKSERT